MIAVTGGAGFIGSNFILDWCAQSDEPVLNIDKLTYAGNIHNLKDVWNRPNHVFMQGDIGDINQISEWLRIYRPRAIVHFAAESHVDRSIHSPGTFITTNVNGTFHLLEAIRAYWSDCSETERAAFRVIHISTDEVYGTLGPNDPPFTETTPYAPNSPYSASKAASDHLVRAYHHTYGLPVITTNCSNNYGPYHFPEKLIPLMIVQAKNEKSLPIYGDGKQIRDWLYVRDHCAAIRLVLEQGRLGETYNIGGNNERTNLEVVETICALLDESIPKKIGSYRNQIVHVPDRPGHDRRYAVNPQKIERELGWRPSETFESGMKKTVQWYLDHEDWIHQVQSGAYRDWMNLNYQKRTEQQMR